MPTIPPMAIARLAALLAIGVVISACGVRAPPEATPIAPRTAAPVVVSSAGATGARSAPAFVSSGSVSAAPRPIASLAKDAGPSRFQSAGLTAGTGPKPAAIAAGSSQPVMAQVYIQARNPTPTATTPARPIAKSTAVVATPTKLAPRSPATSSGPGSAASPRARARSAASAPTVRPAYPPRQMPLITGQVSPALTRDRTVSGAGFLRSDSVVVAEPDFRVARGLNSPPPIVEPTSVVEPIDAFDGLTDEELAAADALLDAELEADPDLLDASP